MRRIVALALALALAPLAASAISRAVPPARSAPPTRIGSAVEGFALELLGVDGEQARVRVTLAPHAPGPPLHVHQGFDETFVVEEGTLHIDLGERVVTVAAGDRLLIPRGQPHRPHNPTDAPVIVSGAQPTMPLAFYVELAALYPCMDRAGSADAPQVLLQLAALGHDVDTWLVGPPLPAQQALRFLLSPWSRLAGFGHANACL